MNFAQWSVWLANLDPIVGSEQGRTRPVLVISDSSLNEILPVVNVIPITSRKPNRRIYQKSEVRSQKSEVRGQKSAVRGQRSEVSGQSEVSQKSEIRDQR